MKLSEPAGRPRLKNILFATDLSSTAEMALAYALKIIERFGATVYAVHVLQPDIYPLPSPALVRNGSRSRSIPARQQSPSGARAARLYA